MSVFHTFARTAVVIALVLCAAPARAQPAEKPVTNQSTSRLRVLLATQAVLHTTDMVTTAYALKLGGTEGNPLLAPLSGRPMALVAVSSSINVLQMYTIAKLHERHPKGAAAWALLLIGAETFAVTNNIRAARQLERARAGGH